MIAVDQDVDNAIEREATDGQDLNEDEREGVGTTDAGDPQAIEDADQPPAKQAVGDMYKPQPGFEPAERKAEACTPTPAGPATVDEGLEPASAGTDEHGLALVGGSEHGAGWTDEDVDRFLGELEDDEAAGYEGLAAGDIASERDEEAPGSGPSNDDEAVDMDALVVEVDAWIDGFREGEQGPSAQAITAEFGRLVREGANELVRDHIIGKLRDAWPNEMAARRTLEQGWQREVRDLREAERRARELSRRPESPDLEDPNAPIPEAERLRIREELWPEVKALAETPDLLAVAVQQVQDLGVTGEEDAIALAVLAGTSRVLLKPVSPLFSGASAAGKSCASQNALRLFPDDEKHVITSGSAKSLVHSQRRMRHSILALFEASPIQRDDNSEYANFLRTLLSEGRIVYDTVVSDDDSPTGHRTVSVEVEGPVSLIVTTTADSIHPENETRMLRHTVDESSEQTSKVLTLLGKLAEDGGLPDQSPGVEIWKLFQTWIGAGPRRVVIPFGQALMRQVKPMALRLRRDGSALLGLIQAHALLHQAQREKDARGYVIATIEDYERVRGLMMQSITRSIGREPSERVKQLVTHVEAKLRLQQSAAPQPKPQGARAVGSLGYSSADELVTSVRRLASELGLDRGAIQRTLTSAIDDGFLVNRESRRGQSSRLALGDRRIGDSAAEEVLPSVDAVRRAYEEQPAESPLASHSCAAPDARHA